MPAAEYGFDNVTNEPRTFGVSCTATGLDLAGVPLLRRDGGAFTPRPAAEIAYLLDRAYRGRGEPSAVDRLDAVAHAEFRETPYRDGARQKSPSARARLGRRRPHCVRRCRSPEGLQPERAARLAWPVDERWDW